MHSEIATCRREGIAHQCSRIICSCTFEISGGCIFGGPFVWVVCCENIYIYICWVQVAFTLISFSMFVATLVYRIAMVTPLSTFASGMIDELMDSPPSRRCGSRASLPMRVSAVPHTRASPYPAANAPQLQVPLPRPGPAGSVHMAKADSALNLPTTSRKQAAFAPLPPPPSAFPGTTH